VHAYCLMRNHFHLVVETPPPGQPGPGNEVALRSLYQAL
jgi:hypothetical protein